MEENNDRKKIRYPRIRFTDLSILGVILSSVRLSLRINIIYLIIESLCAYVGFLPLHSRSWGGECRVESGLYWTITHLYPMTDGSQSYTAPEPVKDFSLLRVLMVTAFLAVIFFIVLSIINKHVKKLLILIAAVAAVIGAVAGVKMAVKKYNDTPIELCSIEVITSDVHQGVCNSLRYPGSAMYLVPAGSDGNRYGYYEEIPIEDGISPESVTKEQLDALLKAAREVRNNRDTDFDGDFAFKIYIVYKTREGYDSVTVWGYEGFPEGWAEFADVLNEICGDAYLRENPELVSFSYDWFSENFGITESDLPGGKTLEDMFTYRRNWLEMDRICGLGLIGHIQTFEPEYYLKVYRNDVLTDLED